MPDPQIRVGITATTNAAEVQIAQAYQKMAAASLELQNVQSRHTDILKAYQKQAFDAATATKFLAENMREQTAAAEKLAAAKQELNSIGQAATATTVAEAAATEDLAAATEHLVPQMAATSGAIRVAFGESSIRAVERFAATTLGLGPILQAAFPVIGAIAFAEILVSTGEKLGKFAADAGALGRELGTGWLDGAIASMTSLGSEIKQADAELLKLAGDRDSIRGKQENQDVDHTRLQTQIDTYKRLTQGLGTENAGNRDKFARAAQEAAAAGERAGDEEHAAQLNRRIAALEKIKILNLQSAEILGKQAESEDEVSRVGSIGIAKIRKEQEVSISQFRDALAEQKLLIQEKNDLILKGVIAGQREGRAGVAAQKENYADELARLEEERGGKNLVFEVEYWRQVVAETGKYHAELLRVEEDEEKLVQRMGEGSKFKKELARDADREEAKPTAQSTQDLQDITDYFNQTGAAYARYRAEVEKGNQVLLQNTARLEEVKIQIAEQSGALSRVAADHALGAVKAKEYADRIQELREQMAALKADLPTAQAEGKGGEAAAQIQALQNQIYALQGQAATARTANAGKTTQDIAGPYVRAFDTINNDWLQLQNKLIFGTRNIGQAFQNMGVSILQSVAGSFEKMLANQLKFELQSIIAHQAANTTKVASDATAAAAGDTIKTTSALKENFLNAKTAATGAFKGVMSVVPPPLNFILAPVAAAAAFAGTLAVGAFEKGGLISAPTLALMGESGTEAVLPNKLTTMLLNVANGGGGSTTSNSSTNFNQSNHYSGITDRDFKQKLRKHSSAIADAVGRELRGGRRA